MKNKLKKNIVVLVLLLVMISIMASTNILFKTYLPLVLIISTPTPSPTATPTPEPILFLNGDFELGPGYFWEEYSSSSIGEEFTLIYQDIDLPILVQPYDGIWVAWLGGEIYKDSEISYIQQTISVPPVSPYLSFWYWIDSKDICGYDFGKVLVNGVEIDVLDLCYEFNTPGWVQRVIDLNAYAGQLVSIQIYAEFDNSLNFTNLYIDHVAFQFSPYEINNPPTVITQIDSSDDNEDVIGK